MNLQATEPSLSIAIMSHPKRAVEARTLASRLEEARVVIDPAPMGAPSPLKTAIHAWRAIAAGATHHLVVQDDIVLSDEFLQRVRAGVALFPDAALTFYANWSSRNAAAIRLAAGAGATWVQEMTGEYFPTLAMVLPAKYIEDYTDLATRFSAWWSDDDDMMREFLMTRDIDAYATAPCLVEHGSLDSVAGNHSHGARQAACFSPQSGQELPYEALAHSIDFVPWMSAGRGQALVRITHEGRQDWLRRPWTDLIEPFELDAADLKNSFDRLIAGSARLQKTSNDLGDIFTFALWVTSYLMGTVKRAHRVPVRLLVGEALRDGDESIVRAGLHTIAAGGCGWTNLPMPVLATYSTETTELAEAGYYCGLAGS
ncbi:MAG TPA: hypothetical protein DGG94_10255 [Micromonosporaceae bacterium]|nr:hypothetical protein [Micromonosporaceae bacterium]HCU50164.1 hypothetical protein [Micromonosporaceae bacterium]